MARNRPSEYLWSRCPICFGGKFEPEKDRLDWTDIIVCLDACFTQRHNHQPRDPARKHPDSFFIPQEEVNAVEGRVDAARLDGHQTKRSRTNGNQEVEEDDHFEPGMAVSKAVLDSCGSSFKAAREFLAKVIPKGSDVTGIMALLCRHDRPLWVVNMTTPGERQHYAIALLEKLFQNLPSFVHVGLLYDIGCHLERSCLKWGLLEDHIDNLIFAISVFHAFGHQWACQLIYHPRKCERFGLSDGEGAERLWHSIQHLIAYTRIAGYHLRLYTLDTQFHFGNTESLLNIGKWIARKYHSLDSKRTENRKELAECGIAVNSLREQWKDQVEKQTRPLPSQSKNKGKQAVQECMHLRQSKKTLEKRLKYLQEIISDPDTADYDVATAEMELPSILDRLEKTKLNVKKKERALGASERMQLHHWVKSQYITKCMNARAILTRLREHLRSRKFELDRVERSCRKQRNEQRLHEHTEDSVRRRDPGIQQLAQKYNRLVKEMKDLIIVRKAPRNVVAPRPIDVSRLFNLDADDELWQDIGLNYDEADDEDAMPPPWLSDDNVRKGIRAMLELDRCEEEEERLAVERKAMRSWFEEEWSAVMSAINAKSMFLD
ncbi:hypothetical protein K435DRAFT_661825 [Dendrothele bispora CBS 962.96]|uniref:CxC1-like cysteine cluster associated with KDZ transposases domain-containing protein n=1 Tax=Dendrothele bispora (strain CBS 962.96) TaxID=1314807 RepID=A0A4S8M6N1_DENBC|nr:hypothetical protein K435DRAFT_661825 [Dendrothele bispora CBS 962.96]